MKGGEARPENEEAACLLTDRVLRSEAGDQGVFAMVGEGQLPTCIVISPEEGYRGKQGFDYFAGVSAQTANSKGICMHTVVIPPGVRANGHYHTHESAIYLFEGEVGMWYGEGLREHLTLKAGQFVYIPAGMPHLAYNPSDTVTVRGVLARTDPNDQETVVLYDAPDPGAPEG